MADSSFYQIQSSSFRNSIYSLDIALEQRYTDFLLRGEPNRVVYSLNDFAFRKRSQTQDLNNLNLPFMNFKVKSIKPDTQRPWFNFMANVEGVYIPELQKKIKLSPIIVEYEATIWFNRSDDTQYAFQLLSYDSDVETQVVHYIQIADQEIPIMGIVSYNLQYEPEYTEKDWLTLNKIHSIGIDFSIQTFYLMDNDNICLPEKVLLNFKALNGIEDNVSNEEVLEFIVNKYDETVTFIEP